MVYSPYVSLVSTAEIALVCSPPASADICDAPCCRLELRPRHAACHSTYSCLRCDALPYGGEDAYGMLPGSSEFSLSAKSNTTAGAL